jgi:hypothetical protein
MRIPAAIIPTLRDRRRNSRATVGAPLEKTGSSDSPRSSLVPCQGLVAETHPKPRMGQSCFSQEDCYKRSQHVCISLGMPSTKPIPFYAPFPSPNVVQR